MLILTCLLIAVMNCQLVIPEQSGVRSGNLGTFQEIGQLVPILPLLICCVQGIYLIGKGITSYFKKMKSFLRSIICGVFLIVFATAFVFFAIQQIHSNDLTYYHNDQNLLIFAIGLSLLSLSACVFGVVICRVAGQTKSATNLALISLILLTTGLSMANVHSRMLIEELQSRRTPYFF